MKQKLLLSLALTLGLASNTWALDQTDGVYQIGTAQDLRDFATIVNGGEYGAFAELTTDINLNNEAWTSPIGSEAHPYTGTFDGQGYAITNFEYTATSDYNGLFGYISNATVKNFSISGTLTSDGFTKNGVVGCATGTTKVTGIHSSMTINVSNFKAHTGGIVGGDNGATTDKIVVDGCEFSGTLTHSGTGDCQAGIMGYTGYSTIRNCIFSGTINGETSRYAGILGYCKQPSFGGVQNCLSIGKITVSSDSSNKGSIIGTWNGDATSNVKNNYYCLKEGSNITRAIGGNTANCEAPHAVTAKELASGEVCYLLNTNGTNWFQTIDTDNNPVPFSTSKRVYKTLADTYINIDGPVQIGDDDDLVNFAVNINHGGTDWDAELTADIDMNGADVSHFPIGTQANPYKGTFDGKGHKISNLQLINNSAPTSYGMFNTGANVTLKNFWLDSSCAIQGTEEVGLVGRHSGGGGRFEGLGNCGNVTGSNRRDGGIIGAAWGEDQTITIKNCWTTGTITGGAVKAGGAAAIIAWFNSATMVMENCWTIAEVSGATSNAKYVYDNGATNTSASTFTNCYSKKGTQPTFSNTISNEQLTSGELCYLLNGSTGGGTDWYQTIGTDNNPFPYSSGHGQVYKNGTFCRDTNFPQGVYSYGNADEVVTGDHDWDEGICSYCGYPKSDYITPTEGYYMIGTPNQLKWFAAYVNAGNPASNAVLTADIDMAGKAWPKPIGDWSNGLSTAYAGKFNGQGHAITNLEYTTTQSYHGLFGVTTSGALIENFSIAGTVTNNDWGQFGGVVGYTRDATTTIRNVKSSVNFVNTKAGQRIGGIVGQVHNGTTKIENCIYSGTLNAGKLTGNYGGIVGYVNNDSRAHLTITNCLFDEVGAISNNGANGECGGIIGYAGANLTDVTIENCLSIGTVDSNVSGQFYGAVKSAKCSIVNSYYQGSAVNGAPSDGVTPTTCEATEADAEQLASGEVAYKLGSAWYQTIGAGADANPVLDSSREKVLYVGAAGYSTFYDADNDWALSSYNGDAKAFIGMLTPSGGALHLEEIDDIPAGTAVIISGTYYNKVSTTATASTTGNILIGSTDYTVPADRDIFALGIIEDAVGFYPVVAGVTIPAGKAYLDLTGSAVKEFLTFVFDDDDPTGINEELRMKNEESSEVIFNLAGQRLNKMQKGINIVNGKKVLK